MPEQARQESYTGQDHGARRAAVLGSPIAHSLSPVLHRAAYAELGLETGCTTRFDVDEEGLAGFLAELDGRWAGLSLTMPLKRAVIPLLDEVSETAASVEAVNTVVFGDDGRRLGDNTDIPGMIAALDERGVETVDRAAVLGAGATAVLRARRARPGLHGRGHRLCAQRGAGARDAAAGASASACAVRTADWARAAEALRRTAGRSPPPRPGPTDGLAPPAPGAAAARSSTSLYAPVADRARRRLDPRAAPSSAGSTCSCTRPCSRSSR